MRMACHGSGNLTESRNATMSWTPGIASPTWNGLHKQVNSYQMHFDMKKYLAIASMALAISLVSCGKNETADSSYVLANSDLLPPVGKTHTVSSIMEMKDGTLNILMAGSEMSGSMNQTMESVETVEPLDADKLRHIIVSETDKGTMVMNGQEQPTPEKPNALTGIPVIVEVHDGKVTASLEEGTPTAEQQTALDKIRRNYETNEDFVMYGDTPREPGDRWDVDASTLGDFAGGTDLSGTFTIEFKSVEEIDGEKRAMLQFVFDLVGKTPGEGDELRMDITLKGKADVIRSINDLVDLDVKLEATMAVAGEPADGMSMSMNGVVIMHQTTELK